jgi:hypothetical protein
VLRTQFPLDWNQRLFGPALSSDPTCWRINFAKVLDGRKPTIHNWRVRRRVFWPAVAKQKPGEF